MIVQKGFSGFDGLTGIHLERARARHPCKKCRKPIFKGESRLVVPVRKLTRRGVFWNRLKYCLECAPEILKEEEDALRLEEYRILKAGVEELFREEAERYVAKRFLPEVESSEEAGS